MINNYKIYSIQAEANQSGLIEIELIILRGLYRFSILGINQRQSSDIKDRVYSALRSQKLLNLKSDNRKITVNLLPNELNKKSNIYDLGIAISCLKYMNHICFDDDVLIIGEISILGNIISTGYILKSIYQSIKNNIKTILCSNDDIKTIENNQDILSKIIIDNNIKFISGDTLDELVKNIVSNKYYIFTKNIISKDIKAQEIVETIDLSDTNIFKIILAICTKRSIIIESSNDSYIKKFIKNLLYYNQKISDDELLKISDILDYKDSEILDKYRYPITFIVNNQIQKNELSSKLKESLFGFNIIENLTDISEENLYIIKNRSVSSILCFFNQCPCGNGGIFFKDYNYKCLCLQRNIIKYRQKIHRIEDNFFDFYIEDTPKRVISYTSDDYVRINKIIKDYRNLNTKTVSNIKNDALYEKYLDKYDREFLDKALILAEDIKTLENLINPKNKHSDLIEKHINDAIGFIKKDF